MYLLDTSVSRFLLFTSPLGRKVGCHLVALDVSMLWFAFPLMVMLDTVWVPWLWKGTGVPKFVFQSYWSQSYRFWFHSTDKKFQFILSLHRGILNSCHFLSLFWLSKTGNGSQVLTAGFMKNDFLNLILRREDDFPWYPLQCALKGNHSSPKRLSNDTLWTVVVLCL